MKNIIKKMNEKKGLVKRNTEFLFNKKDKGL